MIRTQCSQCGVKINAKDELAGQTRKCPACGAAIQIPAAPAIAEPAEEPAAAPAEEASASLEAAAAPAAPASVEAEESIAPLKPHMDRLDRQHRYVVCDPAGVLATWQSNGQGWMVKTTSGMVRAARNRDKLPTEGDFRLVELKLANTEHGLRLVGLACYRLATRWALGNLSNSDDAILRTILGPGPLNRQQKTAIRQLLREAFMPEVWHEAQQVLDYLTNADFHSSGVG